MGLDYAIEEIAKLREKLDDAERDLDDVITERDRAVKVANQLAAKIASIEGLDIGEHSNANDPWTNALAGESADIITRATRRNQREPDTG